MEKTMEDEIRKGLDAIESDPRIPYRIKTPEIQKDLFREVKAIHHNARLCHCEGSVWIVATKSARRVLEWALKDSLWSHTQSILNLGHALDQLKDTHPKKAK